jgi:CubicO group peptidase (beta-lactamase class C family)
LGEIVRSETNQVRIIMDLRLDGQSAVSGTWSGVPGSSAIRSGLFDSKTGVLKLEGVPGGSATVGVVFDGTVKGGMARGRFVSGGSESVPATFVIRKASGDSNLGPVIERIRQTYRLPALGAAIVTGRGLTGRGVTGVRKADADVVATVDDLWHLGSDTKAMTAVLIATFVESGKLTWDTTMGEMFQKEAASFPEAFRGITLRQLLSHHAGLRRDLAWETFGQTNGPLTDQRLAVLTAAAATPLASQPGSRYEYSNLGYVLAGAIVDRIGGRSWEALMREVVFTPLGMTSCGFFGVGTPGAIDQPWPHMTDGQPRRLNGPESDLAAVLESAGLVHCSLADWGKFVADQLSGERGAGVLLKTETYKFLHVAPFGDSYAFGWGVSDRLWAGGRSLGHNGSNGWNYCTVLMAPERDVALLVVTNQGGTAGEMGTRALAAELLLRLDPSGRIRRP